MNTITYSHQLSILDSWSSKLANLQNITKHKIYSQIKTVLRFQQRTIVTITDNFNTEKY